MSFEPAVQPPENRVGDTYWFVFQENRLLVQFKDQGACPPLCGELGSLGIDPLRRQYLGTLNGHACYSVELGIDADPPEGMSFEQLRKLWGSLSEELFWVAGRAFQIMDWDRNHQFCGRCGCPTKDDCDEF